MNAKTEFLKKIEENDLEVKCARLLFESRFIDGKLTEQLYIYLNVGYSPKDYDDFLNKIDIDYDDGFGCQYLFGEVWFTDGTWMDRDEYDGSEWWTHRKIPIIPEYLK